MIYMGNNICFTLTCHIDERSEWRYLYDYSTRQAKELSRGLKPVAPAPSEG